MLQTETICRIMWTGDIIHWINRFFCAINRKINILHTKKLKKKKKILYVTILNIDIFLFWMWNALVWYFMKIVARSDTRRRCQLKCYRLFTYGWVMFCSADAAYSCDVSLHFLLLICLTISLIAIVSALQAILFCWKMLKTYLFHKSAILKIEFIKLT